MKKFFSMILVAVLCITLLPANVFAQSTTSDALEENLGEELEVDSALPNNVTALLSPEQGVMIIGAREDIVDSLDVEDVSFGEEAISPLAEPEKYVTSTFNYAIVDSNGNSGKLRVVVKGIYSQVERWGKVRSISASITGRAAREFTKSTSKNGDTAYVKLYLNGTHFGTFTYRVLTNGTISESAGR